MFNLTTIMNALNDIAGIFTSFLAWCLSGIQLIVGGVIYTIEDGFLTIIVGLVSGLDLSALGVSHIGAWANVPPIYIYLINCLGIPQGMTLLGGAIIIRASINCIPFIRV